MTGVAPTTRAPHRGLRPPHGPPGPWLPAPWAELDDRRAVRGRCLLCGLGGRPVAQSCRNKDCLIDLAPDLQRGAEQVGRGRRAWSWLLATTAAPSPVHRPCRRSCTPTCSGAPAAARGLHRVSAAGRRAGAGQRHVGVWLGFPSVPGLDCRLQPQGGSHGALALHEVRRRRCDDSGSCLPGDDAPLALENRAGRRARARLRKRTHRARVLRQPAWRASSPRVCLWPAWLSWCCKRGEAAPLGRAGCLGDAAR